MLPIWITFVPEFAWLHVLDFEEVLKLEPGNKQALNELQKVQIVRLCIPESPSGILALIMWGKGAAKFTKGSNHFKDTEK